MGQPLKRPFHNNLEKCTVVNLVRSEDVARLTPLRWSHINLLGRYAFSLPEAVMRGELRPLRNPTDPVDELWDDLP
jgi:hypothetical protein